jgi:hypothetical protein
MCVLLGHKDGRLPDELSLVPGLAVLRGDIGLIHDWLLFRGREPKSALPADGREQTHGGRQRYLLFASLTIFLSAMTRVKQSGQTYRTPPCCERDNGRIVAASTRRLHSGHRLIFDGSLLINSHDVASLSG